MNLKAFKMDGLGNDFLIIDRRKNHVSLNKEKIIELGRRDKIGFDQILFIEKETKESTPITIFNAKPFLNSNLLVSKFKLIFL